MNLYIRKTVIFILVLFCFDNSFAQVRSLYEIDANNFYKENQINFSNGNKIESEKAAEKNYWLPALETFGLNMGVWAYNKYLTKEGWSDIGINTVKQNIQTGFQWDNDGFLMNQFAHPYHGSQYFCTARSNNLSYFESMIYSFGGSLMWELLMENQAPSYNDLINTPVSGVILGEVSYRISDLITDESKTGFERGLTEAAALIVSPMRGFNRLIKGDMWKAGNKNINPDFNTTICAGTNSIFFDNNRENRKSYALIGIDLQYGNMMNTNEHHKPFDYFMVKSDLSFIDNSNISNTFVRGVLWDKKIQLFDDTKDILAVYKDLELIINDVYKFTATQISINTSTQYTWPGGSIIRFHSTFSGIALGGMDSKYASIEGKDYNLGPGAAVGGKVDYDPCGIFSFSLKYKKFWIHILSGATGEESAGYLSFLTHLNITKKSAISIETILYHRSAYYDKYAATSSYNSAVKIYYSVTL